MFSIRNIDKNQIYKIMTESKKQSGVIKKNRRTESYKRDIDNFSKNETFDFSKLGLIQKQNISSTGKHHSKSFKRLNENKYDIMEKDFWSELDDILQELDSDG